MGYQELTMESQKEQATENLSRKQLPTGFLRQLPPSEGFSAIPRQAVDSPIHDYFESIVGRFNYSLAVQDESGSLTFGELEALSNRTASALLPTIGKSRNTWESLGEEIASQPPVALLLGHDIKAIAAILGVMKVGGFFIFLEPLHPLERLRFILEDSSAPVLITSDDYLEFALELVSGRQITLLNITEWINGANVEDVNLPISPDALCSLIYTSGSTGRPKGVKRSHRDQMFASWQDNQHFQLTTNDRYAVLDSLGAGGTITHLLAFLFSGGSVHLYNLKRNGLEGFYDWLVQHKITSTTATTTLFRHICQVFSQILFNNQAAKLSSPGDRNGISLPDFRFLITGGEPVRASDIHIFQEIFPPHVYLRVGGGTTEAQWIAESFVNRYTVVGDYGVPWGYPAQEKEIMIWGEDGKPVQEDQIGEVVVKSRYISPGYWRRPELDKEVFLPDPDGGLERIYRTGDLGGLLPNGMLVHHGRLDHMVKVRGFRVELTEIESTLLEMPQVKEALVQPRKNKEGDVSLTAYLVLHGDQQLLVNEIRRFLMEKLPDYMLPASYLFLDTFPLTVNHKVDRSNLPEPPSTRPEVETPFTAPRTPYEAEIAGIWSEILGIEPIGVYDKFLDIGGDSLLATRVLNRIASRYPAPLKLSVLLKQGTVAGLAKLVENALTQKGA